MKQYVEQMQWILPALEDCSDEQLRLIISKYGTFVELLSFWSVMWYAYYRVKSNAGREALIDNIECEWKDSHQMMLNTFLEKCDALPSREVQKIMRDALKPSWFILQKYAQKDSAFAHISFLALAENTSLSFIHRLAQAATKLWCDDLTYTDIHGEADIKHANLFEKAFYEEKENLWVSDSEAENIVQIYFDLMKIIFSK